MCVCCLRVGDYLWSGKLLRISSWNAIPLGRFCRLCLFGQMSARWGFRSDCSGSQSQWRLEWSNQTDKHQKLIWFPLKTSRTEWAHFSIGWNNNPIEKWTAHRINKRWWVYSTQLYCSTSTLTGSTLEYLWNFSFLRLQGGQSLSIRWIGQTSLSTDSWQSASRPLPLFPLLIGPLTPQRSPAEPSRISMLMW